MYPDPKYGSVHSTTASEEKESNFRRTLFFTQTGRAKRHFNVISDRPITKSSSDTGCKIDAQNCTWHLASICLDKFRFHRFIDLTDIKNMELRGRGSGTGKRM